MLLPVACRFAVWLPRGYCVYTRYLWLGSRLPFTGCSGYRTLRLLVAARYRLPRCPHVHWFGCPVTRCTGYPALRGSYVGYTTALVLFTLLLPHLGYTPVARVYCLRYARVLPGLVPTHTTPYGCRPTHTHAFWTLTVCVLTHGCYIARLHSYRLPLPVHCLYAHVCYLRVTCGSRLGSTTLPHFIHTVTLRFGCRTAVRYRARFCRGSTHFTRVYLRGWLRLLPATFAVWLRSSCALPGSAVTTLRFCGYGCYRGYGYGCAVLRLGSTFTRFCRYHTPRLRGSGYCLPRGCGWLHTLLRLRTLHVTVWLRLRVPFTVCVAFGYAFYAFGCHGYGCYACLYHTRFWFTCHVGSRSLLPLRLPRCCHATYLCRSVYTRLRAVAVTFRLVHAPSLDTPGSTAPPRFKFFAQVYRTHTHHTGSTTPRCYPTTVL